MQWFLSQAIIALKKGAYLLKYGRRGKPKFCPFRLSNVSHLSFHFLISLVSFDILLSSFLFSFFLSFFHTTLVLYLAHCFGY